MKRALRQRLNAFVAINSTGLRTGLQLDQARDVLDSDARLRKQVADLKARLRLWRDALAHAETLSGQLPLTVEQLLRPTKPHYFDLLKLKSWRKGGE